MNRARKLFLPDLLAKIAAIAGDAAALKVAAVKGGQRAYFPRHPGEGHWLTEACGLDNARKIGEALATGLSGAEFDVPMGPDATMAQRWRRIIALRRQGVSKPAIARMVRCSHKTVQRIANGKRKTVEAAVAQRDFFDAAE